MRKELWKDAILYEASAGGTCGMWLKEVEEGKGDLTLFFDEQTSPQTSFHFEEYVRAHLQKKSLPESVQSRRIFRCICGIPPSDQLVRRRIEKGLYWYDCPDCGARVDLRDPRERLAAASPSQVVEMDKAADMQRARAAAQSTIQGKQETNDFDVYLCYNRADEAAIIDIGERLKSLGILPWLDIWEQRPGLPQQSTQEEQIRKIKTAAVFVGRRGMAPWQQQQSQALLREFVEKGCPVIPVILHDVSENQEPEIPLFLKNNVLVDFRKRDSEPIDLLYWGITGKRRSSRIYLQKEAV